MKEISKEFHFQDRFVSTFIKRDKNFWHTFKKNVKKNPSNIAAIDEDVRISYKEIYNLAIHQSYLFFQLGIKKGDRVCVLYENSWPLLIYILAGLKEGIIIVPLNPKSSIIENEIIINDCTPNSIFFDKLLIKNIPEKQKIISVKNFLNFDKKQIKKIKIKNQKTFFSVEEEDPAFILYTSGTTGKPKGAIITNINIIHSCFHFKRHFSLSDKDNSILVVPASHVTGLIAHIMTMFFSAGTLILMKKFDVKEFLNLAEKEKLTYLIMVPAMYNLCLFRDDFSKYNLSSWRIGCFGGASMPLGTIKKLKSLLPKLLLVNAYGSTETCSPATLMPLKYKDNLIASVGKVVETGKIIIMNDNNEEVSNEETGELWVFGPMVIPGYWKNRKKTLEEFVNGYWKSGDIGYRDKNGYIYILDRKKDVINRGGYKIYSSEIENLISLTGLVVEVAVIPHMDPILGEKIHVVIYSDNLNDNLEKLQKLCLKNLSEYKQPDYWTCLNSELPKNKNGKILKTLLIDQMKDKF